MVRTPSAPPSLLPTKRVFPSAPSWLDWVDWLDRMLVAPAALEEFCIAPLAFTFFRDARLFTEFGDLLPMIRIFRSMV